MTWVEGSCLTHWATQVPLAPIFSNILIASQMSRALLMSDSWGSPTFWIIFFAFSKVLTVSRTLSGQKCHLDRMPKLQPCSVDPITDGDLKDPISEFSRFSLWCQVLDPISSLWDTLQPSYLSHYLTRCHKELRCKRASYEQMSVVLLSWDHLKLDWQNGTDYWFDGNCLSHLTPVWVLDSIGIYCLFLSLGHMYVDLCIGSHLS